MNILSYGLGYDPTRFLLGSLCKRNHDWESSGKSLRTQGKHPSCIECKKLSHKQWEKQNRDKEKLYKAKVTKKRTEQPIVNAELIESLGYDSKSVYLGVLCSRNHNVYQEQSIRSRKSGLCVQCGRLRHIPKPKRKATISVRRGGSLSAHQFLPKLASKSLTIFFRLSIGLVRSSVAIQHLICIPINVNRICL